MSSASTIISTMSVFVEPDIRLKVCASCVIKINPNSMTHDIITAKILPRICAFVNCEQKSYSSKRIRIALTISRYCTGRIENVMILNKKRIVRISWISTRTSPAATRLPRCLRLSALGESLSLSLKRYFKSPFVRLIIFDIIISIPQAI